MEDNLKRMIEIMDNYQKKKKTNKNDSQQLKLNAKNSIIEIINNEIEFEESNERLQMYLENTNITDLNFLYRSLEYMRGNNQDGRLSFERFAFLDEDIRNLINSYDIFTEADLFEVIFFFSRGLHNPLLNDEEFINFWNKAHKLAYLDIFFKNTNNCLAYQGSYTTYKYVKKYLKEVLKEDSQEKDKDLVYKDINKKLNIVTENLVPIANELLTLRNQVPESRISVCNQGLKKTTVKKENSPITFEQQIFINAIAFGTTLEKLKDRNYEDAKQLLYLPHQRIKK